MFKNEKLPGESITKIEYWKKWQIPELIEELHLAAILLSDCNDGYSHEYISIQEFCNELNEEISELEHANRDVGIQLNKIYDWFVPTSVWDDYTGKKGEQLGNIIFEKVNRWKQNQP